MKTLVCIALSLVAAPALGAEKITLGCVDGSAPLASRDLPGFGLFPDLVAASFKEVGQPVEFQAYPFNRIVPMVKAGEVAGVLSPIGNFAGEENKTVVYDRPVITGALVFFYKQSRFPNGLDVRSIDELGKLAKYKIGILRGAPQQPLLQSKGLNLEEVAEEESDFKKLAADRIDLVSTADLIGLYLLRQLKIEGCVASEPLTLIPMTVVFTKANPRSEQLSKDLTRGWEAAKKNGTLAKVLEKYFGPNGAPAHALK